MFHEMDNPKVSIVIPVYNGTNYMRDAINCALNQTYSNIEVIVVNDGSCDNGATDAVAKSYGDRIRYFLKENGGVSSALNYGISKMTGDYMAWLSHDDMYSPSRIQDAVDLLKRHDMLGKKCVGFSGGYVMDAEGTRIKDLRNKFEANRIYTGYEVLNIMTVSGTLYGCSFLFPRNVFDKVGGFDESLRYSQDSLMWYRIFLARYSLVSDNKPNVMSRMHGTQVSHTRRDLFANDALVVAKALAQPLALADQSGGLLRNYLKRLTKYECTDAISYLYDYARNNGCLRLKDRIEISVFRFTGAFRYRIVSTAKKAFIHFRR